MNSTRYVPEEIKMRSENKVMRVFAGSTFTMFLTSQNQLLSCGMNDLGQLGLGENQDFTASVVEEADVGKPTLIEPLEEMKVRNVSCGENHSIAQVSSTE